jgi:phage anti-repressor protein
MPSIEELSNCVLQFCHVGTVTKLCRTDWHKLLLEQPKHICIVVRGDSTRQKQQYYWQNNVICIFCVIQK